MTHVFDGFNYIVRLKKGELLIESLTMLAKEQKITGAWISGLGAALWCELGFYHLDTQEYSFKRIDPPAGALEITGLQGNIAWADDKPVIHIHGSFSDEQMRGYGGHVKELAAGATCEIFLHQSQVDFKRSYDEQTGLKLLDLQ